MDAAQTLQATVCDLHHFSSPPSPIYQHPTHIYIA
uniref:Uncharacterized protein n=1 Tax=Anguilla anguilla TaxID=7936 RepID=A0A0E9XLR5_ANGAN